jgi:3-methyladenine DNA glycosylase AlkD
MGVHVSDQVAAILVAHDPASPRATADRLRDLWLQFEPVSTAGIKAEQRAQQETVGIPVPVLKAIGKEVGKAAGQRVDDYLPLVQVMWDEYGREGRVVAATPLGAMELVEPETVMPLLMDLCRSCVTWEDADHFAMNAVEPIVRRDPGKWLGTIEPWLADDNKWVRRVGALVAGRLPMKHPACTVRCVGLIERLLLDEDVDVKKGVSFALRLCARGEVDPVLDLLDRHVPPEDLAATWVLCDAVRSMAKRLLPQFAPLLPRYEQWAADPALSARDRRSVASAVKTLQRVQE